MTLSSTWSCSLELKTDRGVPQLGLMGLGLRACPSPHLSLSDLISKMEHNHVILMIIRVSYFWKNKKFHVTFYSACDREAFECHCCCSVTQLCLTPCNPIICSVPGFPVLHYVLEFVQTHVHWVDDDIQPSHNTSYLFYIFTGKLKMFY